MSRPLIIKVDSHKSQPSKKATGSIDMQLLKGFNTKGNIATTNSEIDNSSIINVVKEDQYNPPEESGSQSIVRSLISRYETSPEQANLIKYKSKSMVDLQKPQISMVTTKTTQDDSLYNKGKYNDGAENQKFDFKKVFLKFETSSQSGPKRSNVTNHSINHFKNKMSPHNNDSLDLVSLKQKAKTLLEQYEQDHDYSNWQNKVLELLQQISGSHEMPQVVKPSYFNKSIKIETSPSMYKLERTETAKEVELSTNRKVRDIKNLFENNNDDVKPFSRSVSSYATYFGVDEDSIYLNRAAYSNRSISATPFNDDYNNNEMEKEKSEESEMSENDSEAIEGKRTVTQPIPASSMKIQELKNFFESDPDKYVPYGSYIENDQPEQSDMASNTFNISETDDVQVVENQILPPLKMFVLEEETDRHVDIEDSKQRLEDLTKDIEDCEQQIKTLSETNKEEDEDSMVMNDFNSQQANDAIHVAEKQALPNSNSITVPIRSHDDELTIKEIDDISWEVEGYKHHIPGLTCIDTAKEFREDLLVNMQQLYAIRIQHNSIAFKKRNNAMKLAGDYIDILNKLIEETYK